jgi:hypothetical protein
MGTLFPGQVFSWTTVDPENSSVRRGVMKAFEMKVEAVCRKCNSGWMSKIEEQIKPMLSGTIKDGESMYFGPKDRTKLGAFTFKNAVISNYLNPKREPFFTRAIRERFRTSREIPPGVFMWFASLKTAIPSGLYLNYVLGLQIGTNSRFWDDLEMCVYTFVVGYLALQFVAFRYEHIGHRNKPLPTSLSSSDFWNDYCVSFWPNSRDTLRWPPQRSLNEKLLHKFVHRWEGPTTVLPT